MEKFGKTIQVLLSEEEVKLVQTPLDTDGAQVMASFPIVSSLQNRTVQ
jgi:hypothetical protein